MKQRAAILIFLIIMITAQGFALYDSNRVSYTVLDNNTCEVSTYQSYSTPADLVIPSSVNGYTVVGIGKDAFMGSNSLKTVTLPSSLKYIGDFAFADCGLTKINIPDGVTSIGRCALRKAMLTSITIPESVTTIGESVFSGISTMTEVYYNAIDADVDRSIDLTARSRGSDENWSDLFRNYRLRFPTTVEKVVFGPNVKAIPWGAFMDCKKLIEINLPESVERIGVEAFSRCTGLTELYMGANVKHIGNRAFEDCARIKKITFSPALESIGSAAFRNCGPIKSITLPKNLKTIGDGAFQECYDIEEVYIDSFDLQQTLADYRDNEYGLSVLSNVLQIKKIVVGVNGGCSLMLFNNVVGIDLVEYNAIQGQDNEIGYMPSFVKDVIIGDDVEYIPSYFVCENPNIIEIKLPSSIKRIGKSAFKSLAYVTEVELPESLTCIDDYAFYGCECLSHVKWNKNLEKIGKFAFADCPIYNLDFHEGIEKIEDGAFSGNSAVENLVIPKSLVDYERAFTSLTNLKYLYYNPLSVVSNVGMDLPLSFKFPTSLEAIELGENLQCIPNYYFVDMVNLKNVTFHHPVNGVGKCAFKGCVSLKELVIPGNAAEIGAEAFSGCTSLRRIVIPDNVSSIADKVFYNCSYLEHIDFPKNIKSIGIQAFYNCSSLSDIDIPDKVETIGEQAFYNCSCFTELNFPDQISSIGKEAFFGCPVKSVKFGGNPVNIYEDAFSGNQITHLEFKTEDAFLRSEYKTPNSSPSSDAGVSLFIDGVELTEITYPEDINKVCPAKFRYLSNLDVKMHKKITSIGAEAFIESGITDFESECLADMGEAAFFYSKLTRFVEDGPLTVIPQSAFASNSDLEWLELSDNITTLGFMAMFIYKSENSNLKVVKLPKYLQKVDKYNNLSGAKNLEAVYYGADTPREFSNLEFCEEAYENAILYVPEEAISKAKETFPWRKFSKIIAYDFRDEGSVDSVTVVSDNDSESVKIYNLSGVYVGNNPENLAPGIYIQHIGSNSVKIKVR